VRKRLLVVTLAIASGLQLQLPLVAAEPGGTKPLLCAVAEVSECGHGTECRRVSPVEVNAPEFLRVDVAGRVVRAVSADGADQRSAAIENVRDVDGRLVLQGIEAAAEGARQDVGWTLAIAGGTGRMVLTASGEEAGFVLFGSCLPL
jgi:hypothetical protein